MVESEHPVPSAVACIAAAARWLKAAWADPTPVLWPISEPLPEPCLEKHIRALADRVGLSVCRPNPTSLTHLLEPGCIWIARIADGDGVRFVLVLDWMPNEGAFVVADPSSEQVVGQMSLEDFASAWRVWGTRKRWAASLHRRCD